MTERELLRQLVDALDKELPHNMKHIAAGQRFNARVALAQSEQEPVAWATREDFYRELDRSVNRMRQQMEIKGVVMRCADYDIALPVIDIREGRVLVGQVTAPPQRTWEGLSVFEINDLVENTEYEDYRDLVERTEAKLKEKNT